MMPRILQIEEDVIHPRTFASAEVDDIFRDLHNSSHHTQQPHLIIV